MSALTQAKRPSVRSARIDGQRVPPAIDPDPGLSIPRPDPHPDPGPGPSHSAPHKTAAPAPDTRGNSHDPHGTLHELEHCLHLATEAYRRWIVHAMQQAGHAGLSSLDGQLVLHLGRQSGATTFIALCAATAIEDQHLAHYALRKLRKAGLIEIGRRGKEKVVTLNAAGEALYLALDEQHATALNRQSRPVIRAADMAPMIRNLRRFSVHYDDARRIS